MTRGLTDLMSVCYSASGAANFQKTLHQGMAVYRVLNSRHRKSTACSVPSAAAGGEAAMDIALGLPLTTKDISA
jgi:hypothetical protein